MLSPSEDSTEPILPIARRVRVLVAEDNRINQMVMQAMLSSADIDVVLVDNGAECLDQIDSVMPDVVLMDCQMPVCDGYTASRRLREAGWSVPIIAVTASAVGDEEARCRQAGMDGFLPKPVFRDALLEALADVGATPEQ